MIRNSAVWLSLLAGLGTPALAAPFDGSQPFICALVEVQMCKAGEKCAPQSLEAVDAPRFLKISVADKKITGNRPSGTNVDANIELVRHSADMMFLQGAQQAFSWNMVIREIDGRMTLALADGENGGVAFGECTLH